MIVRTPFEQLAWIEGVIWATAPEPLRIRIKMSEIVSICTTGAPLQGYLRVIIETATRQYECDIHEAIMA